MKILFSLYQWFIALPILLTLTILTALTTIIGCLVGNGDFWGYYPGKIWSILFCNLSFSPVRTKGFEKIDRTTSYIFVANHQSAYDIFIIYGYLGQNFKWIMKESLKKIPLVGKACRSAGHIFIDRSSNAGIRKAMHQAERTLRNGTSLVVFPEGTRTYTGKLGRFKKGAFQMAIDLNLPIVPLTIDGAFKVLPRTSFLIRPHTMTLVAHDPIYPQPDNENEAQRLLDESHKAIESGLNRTDND